MRVWRRAVWSSLTILLRSSSVSISSPRIRHLLGECFLKFAAQCEGPLQARTRVLQGLAENDQHGPTIALQKRDALEQSVFPTPKRDVGFYKEGTRAGKQ